MTKFVPELKPRLMVVYFKNFEAWMVVFGWNQVWSSFGFDLNLKFSRAHLSASFFLSLALARCSSVAAACCRVLCRPLHCLCYYRPLHPLQPHACACERSSSGHRGRPLTPPLYTRAALPQPATTRRHEDQGHVVGLDVKPLYHRDVYV
jgi:hypothetical protein